MYLVTVSLQWFVLNQDFVMGSTSSRACVHPAKLLVVAFKLFPRLFTAFAQQLFGCSVSGVCHAAQLSH